MTPLTTRIEAILTVIGEPVTTDELATALEVSPQEIEQAIEELHEEYSTGRVSGFEIRKSAGGWQFYSRSEHYDTVKQFLTRGQTAKLSQAALETLAVVAYAQPVTRARIAAIRGVNVDGVVRTLLMRGLIVEAPKQKVPPSSSPPTCFCQPWESTASTNFQQSLRSSQKTSHKKPPLTRRKQREL